MRIGITLQSLDPTWGGIGIYTQEIVRSLLTLDRQNEYVLMYPGFGAARKLYGQYRKYRNVQEIETYASRVPSGWYWIRSSSPPWPSTTGSTSSSTHSSPFPSEGASARS